MSRFFSYRPILLNNLDNFLLSGISNGFDKVPNLTLIPECDCANYSSALLPAAKKFLDKIFVKELAEGKMSRHTNKPHACKPLEMCPKKGQMSSGLLRIAVGRSKTRWIRT